MKGLFGIRNFDSRSLASVAFCSSKAHADSICCKGSLFTTQQLRNKEKPRGVQVPTFPSGACPCALTFTHCPCLPSFPLPPIVNETNLSRCGLSGDIQNPTCHSCSQAAKLRDNEKKEPGILPAQLEYFNTWL